MDAYLAFVAVAVAAMLIPGPDTLVVLRTALRDGSGLGAWAAGGSATGNVIWGITSTAGVAGVLAASATAFSILKLLGAAYLIWLGAQALRAAVRGDVLVAATAGRTPTTRRRALMAGLASDLLNVKVGLFWTAVVPQFLTAGTGLVLPAAMVTSMGLIVFVWLVAYAVLAARARSVLASTRVARAINTAIGTAFVGLGVRLAVAER